jgi:hypothetical protein
MGAVSRVYPAVVKITPAADTRSKFPVTREARQASLLLRGENMRLPKVPIEQKQAEIKRMAKKGYVPVDSTVRVDLIKPADLSVVDVRHKRIAGDSESYIVLRFHSTSRRATVFMNTEDALLVSKAIQYALGQEPEVHS